MQSYARSLTLTAALLVASIVGVLLVAAQDPKVAPGSAPTAIRRVTETKAAATPPITFADPDGQELILEELSVRTAIHGMLSLTELDLRFRNPQDRRIEGRFTTTLPPNAAISRFAKDVNGQLMEGEVVERLRANQVYEQFLHQMRDPALLEQEQGNRFSARIFPIEAKAPVHIVLSYTALLPVRDGLRTYAFPLRGMSKVNRFTFRAFVTPIPGEGTPGRMSTSTAEVTSFDETNWTPDRDIVLSWKGSEGGGHRILRAGDFYLAAYRPSLSSANRQPSPSSWRFYIDTSASSAEGAPHRLTALEEILGALPANDQVQLVAFDQDVVPLASGSAAELSRRAGELLRARLFLGGTDIGALLRDAARSLRDDPSRAVVIASDLVPTVGTVAPHELKESIDALPSRGIVHALILGSREDAATAKAVTAGRGRIVRIPFTESLASRAREAAGDLRRPLGGTVDVNDAAAEWLYPSRFEDVQPGDEVIALGKLKAGREPEVKGSVTSLDSSTFGPLLEREAYRAYLEYLAQREAAEPSDAVRRALGTEQVRISIEQRVVIPRTTMLVLESEWDYQRFGLDRRALAAILTIEAGGIGRLDRRALNWTPPPVPDRQPVPAPRRDRPVAKSAAPPAPTTVPLPQGFMEESQEEVEDGVVGGVVGGVEGGVPGGVVGGVVSGVAASPVAEAITVTSEAPRIERRSSSAATADRERDAEAPAEAPALRVAPGVPPPPPPPPALIPDDAKSGVSWLRQAKPSRDAIAALEQKLQANPRDRELYNQLSESLAALGEWNELRSVALRWQPYDPENPQVYEVLGMADAKLGRDAEAARAYASLIEVAPGKTELLQRAGLLLLQIRRGRLAEAPLRRALELRPDRANAYRSLALLLWRDGRVEEAARVLESATQQNFPGWYGEVQRVIREELGYVYRAWLKKDESRRREIEQRAREHQVDLERGDALRITLVWETDANDVDLHVVDPRGEEVYYSHKNSRSGLELYQDITQGLGPEVIRTSEVDRGTYHIGVRYFAAGPMGISRGLVVVMRNDEVEIHPFRLVQGGEAIRYVAAVTVK
jgi:tetratricopeptide (TPR) repeat protein